MHHIATADEILAFWQAAGPERWFREDPAFDEEIRRRFLETYEAAARGDLDDWELDPQGALAVLILLDQFPRNLFRGTRRMYATDPTAALAAERAIERGHDKAFAPPLCRLFYLPFSHSEDLAHQDRAVTLNEAAGDTDGLTWARHHRDLIARFGRFPHRNALLGRESTEEEKRFLAQEGSFKG